MQREIYINLDDLDGVDPFDADVVVWEGQRFTLEAEYSRSALYVGDDGTHLYVFCESGVAA